MDSIGADSEILPDGFWSIFCESGRVYCKNSNEYSAVKSQNQHLVRAMALKHSDKKSKRRW